MEVFVMDQQYKPNFRTFLFMWLAESLSLIGTGISLFAISIWMVQVLFAAPEQRQQLAGALSLNALAFALPTVLIAPLAGVWADRHNRKRTMIVANLLSFCISAVFVLLLVTNSIQFWMLIAVTAALGICATFHNACFETTYSVVVPREQLSRANGMMQTAWSFPGIIAPPIAAAVMALPMLAKQGHIAGAIGNLLGQVPNGTSLAVVVDALSFLMAAAVILFLKMPALVRTDLIGEAGKPKKSMGRDLKEGAIYVWRIRPFFWLFAVYMVLNLIVSPLGVILPLLLKIDLQADLSLRGFSYEAALALLTSVGSAGALLGGIFMSAWVGLKSKRIYGVMVPTLVTSIALLILGVSPLLYVTTVMIFLERAMVAIIAAHSFTILQAKIPPVIQGRVFSVVRFIATSTYPLGIVLLPLAAGVFDPGAVIAVLGGFIALFAVSQLFNRRLVNIEDMDTSTAIIESSGMQEAGPVANAAESA